MPRKNSVLVIELDPGVRHRVCGLLEELGCETHIARHEVLRQGVPQGYDLIVCDWVAWVASSEVPLDERRLPRSPRVILLVHTPDESLWVLALRAGAFDLVEEPNSPDSKQEFRRVVTNALGLVANAHANAAA